MIKLVLILTIVCTLVCAGSLLEQPIAPRLRARHRARAHRAVAENNTLQFVLFSPRTISESQYCNFGISDESIELSYRNVPDTNNDSWMPLETLPLGGDCNMTNFSIPLPDTVDPSGVQFRWIQWEHGGGFCNCWGIDNIHLNNTLQFSDITNVTQVSCDSRGASIGTLGNCSPRGLAFCGGSASAPRGVVSRVFNIDTSDVSADCNSSGALVEDMGTSPISDSVCNDTFIKLSFLLYIGDRFDSGMTVSGCDRVEAFSEGVELSVRGKSQEKWMPLKFYTPEMLSNFAAASESILSVGEVLDNSSDVVIRGYTVPVGYTMEPIDTVFTEYICGEDRFIQEGFQFRFSQTAMRGFKTNTTNRDVWSIDDVQITLHSGSRPEDCNTTIFEFNGTSLTPWEEVQRGILRDSSSTCAQSTSEGIALVFGYEDVDRGSNIFNRIAITPPLNLSSQFEQLTQQCFGEPTPTPTPTPTSTPSPSTPPSLSSSTPPSPSPLAPPSTSPTPTPTPSPPAPPSTSPTPTPSPSTSPTPTPSSTSAVSVSSSLSRSALPTQTPSPVSADEAAAQLLIDGNPASLEIDRLINDDPGAALELLSALVNGEDVDKVAATLLLGKIGEAVLGSNVSREFSETFIGVASSLVNQEEDQEPSTTVGSTLLDVLDKFALGPYDESQDSLDTDNIALMAESLVPEDIPEEGILGIEREGNSIQLPPGLFENTNMTLVSVASFFYRNMSGLLPNSLPGLENTNMRLASSVVSSALQCGEERCDTSSINLTTPVRIQFRNTPEVQRAGSNVTCVFLEFEPLGTILMSGHWAVNGCERSSDSTADTTICECNHLTHFALLLSPAPPEFSEEETISLEIIGIVGVTVSLLALTITIATFIFLRSLWTMRNYIHVNLCANLMIAQLIFVVGVEPRGSTASCQAIAVILHYFFLVTFMWMLMEGVVLYVALVRVFIKNQGRYIIAFTVFSYGLPLLYLGLTVPLGLALENGPHYAGDDPEACWLRYDTHFIWAFIAPVILIILANVGFFIMAVTIMYRHEKRQTHKTKVATVKHWLKASISLVIVMGITWIIGVLIFHEALFFIAWIFTILVGLQGVLIFILFVALSKQVREAYAKWWKVKVNNSEFLSRRFKSTPSTTMPTISLQQLYTPLLPSKKPTVPQGHSCTHQARKQAYAAVRSMMRTTSPSSKVEKSETSMANGETQKEEPEATIIPNIASSHVFNVLLFPAGSLENLADPDRATAIEGPKDGNGQQTLNDSIEMYGNGGAVSKDETVVRDRAENDYTDRTTDIEEQKDGNSQQTVNNSIDIHGNGEAVSKDETVVRDRAENDYVLPPELQGESECTKL